MTDRFQTDTLIVPAANPFRRAPVLPVWLQARLLRGGEQLTAVYGPGFNPQWERYVTHPALFLVALVLAALWVGEGWLLAGSRPDLLPWMVLAAGIIVLGSIFVLGIAAGYFTRVVVTNCRLVILQGYEVCRVWRIEDLPYSLIHYSRPQGGGVVRSIDLDTLSTMLGGASDKVVEAKTILAFSKHLEHIKAREKGRP
jgi:hypothetical protein